ncbi:alpha/beta fold hydrolase [Crenobacter sp. SG2305]|uniref:alpha/beta hydrolase n=1 Tax=Crenobacter oryzisoli TaxID=3056844 RepID=UPI0025AA822D|nr:alpha/beta fold hydrolase [Crenobacter sp. SG2305]MDN0084216.1 alpha/beta fold hydrolase [Crenobacter sp. SG2305]
MTRIRLFLVILIGLALLVSVGRYSVFLLVERQAFTTTPRGTLTPEKLGVPSQQIVFHSGDRALHGSYVQTPRLGAAAVLIFHGDEESIADWAYVQKLLYENGVSSFVFDYSGYGSSTGAPTVRHLDQDGLSAHQRFMALTPQARRHYLLGFSLGAAVLLDILPDLHPAPNGVVIASGFASAREATIAVGLMPKWLAWLLPDVWDNESRMRLVQSPVLIVHSRADEVLDWHQAVRLSKAVTSPHRLVMLDALTHDAAITPQDQDRYWGPILGFFHSGDVADIGMAGLMMSKQKKQDVNQP